MRVEGSLESRLQAQKYFVSSNRANIEEPL